MHVYKDFTLQRTLGEGAFGRTYLATHTVLGYPVCLKLLLALEHKILFREEAALLAKVRHPFLPSLLGYWEEGDKHVIALSFLKGTRLDQVPAVDDEHMCWVLDRLLEALSYLHYRSEDPDYDRGIVHGDIKPQNILLHTCEHEAYLVDFGLAGVNQHHAKGGTPLYLAPEVAKGYSPSPASDLYALGKTAVYMGRGDVSSGVPPKDMHPLLVEWIHKMTAQDPGSRFESADLARMRLRELREEAFGRIETPEEFKERP